MLEEKDENKIAVTPPPAGLEAGGEAGDTAPSDETLCAPDEDAYPSEAWAECISDDGRFELASTDALRPSSEHDKRKTVPLVALIEAKVAADALATPPPYAQLPIIGLLHDRMGALAGLAETGRAFLDNAARQTSGSAQQFDALRTAWLVPYPDEVL